MVYDVKLMDEELDEIFWVSQSSETTELWRRVGVDLSSLDGLRAGECSDRLETALMEMLENVDNYEKLGDLNSNGAVKTTFRFLADIVLALRLNPETTVRVN